MEIESARALIERLRWGGDGAATCPRCGVAGRAYRLRTRAGQWKCGACRRQFSVTVGTVLEDSRVPLELWVRAAERICGGGTVRELRDALGVSRETACRMGRRLCPAARPGLGAEDVLGLVLRMRVEKRETKLQRRERMRTGAERARAAREKRVAAARKAIAEREERVRAALSRKKGSAELEGDGVGGDAVD